ncbi:aminotransferase class V-fold PLP-dependent enzyme [Salegentibacter flavus]|uniref:Selenocysteine lyase/Cysteine desulfurase n=1 Tax=Salegentibacter flavus TaxID=287099 RepID=A0A1I4YZC8_9FLAO|nr:aminotransferase class V-fold PLP-dependent enzyme [Salegentibacter flavus]SFN43059.1 Selenocysteine lyase/Cysteine desulfurase [Salegentibacter flavus]
MDKFRKGFPVLEQYTYLNTAASGLLPEKVWEFRQDHDLDFLIKAGVLKEKMGELLTEVRESVGSFFNCPANQVALVPNFSFGFNTLLEGLEKPQKALLLKQDYPSINWAVESRNFEVSYAEIDENLEQNIAEAFKKEQPDFFAFSIVQYLNGIKLSIDFFKELKENYPDTIFIADGTQYCGTEEFDFEASGLDVLICSSYKWLNAGYGNGFMLFNESIQGKVSPKALGFGSLQGKYKEREGNFIGKFEPGHLDTLNFGSLKVALELLKTMGLKEIENQLQKLLEKSKAAFEELGLLEEAVIKREQHSSIFNIKGDEKLYNSLRSQNIITSRRGDGIRISFHYFNTEKEVDFLIKQLKKFAG